MKFRTRLISAVICLALILSCFTACTKDDKNPAGNTEAPAADITAEPTAEPEPTPVPDPDIMVKPSINAPYAADFTVANVFSTNMVVQRGERLRVWGWAEESENGKKVSAEFMGMFAEAVIENGAWEIQFGAKLDACAEKGHSMKIYTDTKEVVFEDVLVGDVFMVIGQSNVAYGMNAHWSAVRDVERGGQKSLDKDAPIRLNYNSLSETSKKFPKRGTTDVCADKVIKSKWKLPTQSNVSNFTAIGYLFATNLLKLTNNTVPVGLIEIDGNGQPLGAFMPNEVADACKSDTYNEKKGYYTTEGCNGDAARYMYNHYMYPFERYAMAGVVWYQGESDFADNTAKVFAQNFAALMTYMRGTHNVTNPDFPVYLVEFPTIYTNKKGISNWAYMDLGKIRAVLGSVPQYLPNSYIGVSSDVWPDDTYWNSLHPNCKYEQAEKLARICYSVWYNGTTLDEATGPILDSITISDDGLTAVLTYKNVGTGLATSDGGTAVLGYKALGDGYRILSAKVTAEITGTNQVTVTSSSSMTGVAYNIVSDNFYGKEINLCNSYGNPASAVTMYAK